MGDGATRVVASAVVVLSRIHVLNDVLSVRTIVRLDGGNLGGVWGCECGRRECQCVEVGSFGCWIKMSSLSHVADTSTGRRRRGRRHALG